MMPVMAANAMCIINAECIVLQYVSRIMHTCPA